MASPLLRRVTADLPSESTGEAGTRRTPDLRLAVVPRRRRLASFAVGVSVLVATVLMGVAFLHTRIAERQLEIDRLERGVRVAQAEFDILRAERAELRSPNRLATRAEAIGMSPGRESEFIDVDPMTLAITIARTGEMPFQDSITPGSNARLEPLDQFRLVKGVSSESP